VNTAHPLIEKLLQDEENSTKNAIASIAKDLAEAEKKRDDLKATQKDKKDEEIPTAEKDELETFQKKIDELNNEKKNIYKVYAGANKQVSQLIDLALLANNMLKGEALAKFVSRSVELL